MERPSEVGSVHSGGRFSTTIVKCLLKMKQLSSFILVSSSSTRLMFSRKYFESTQAVSSSTLVFRLESSLTSASRASSPQGRRMASYWLDTAYHSALLLLIDRFSQQTPPDSVSFRMQLIVLQSMKASLRKTMSSTSLVTSYKLSLRYISAFLMYLPAYLKLATVFSLFLGAYSQLLPNSQRMNSAGVILSRYLRVSSRRRSYLTVYETAGSVGILRQWLSMRVISLGIELSSQGQEPKSISQRMTPSDHRSALESQTSPLSTSGAMQMGEPTMVCAMSFYLRSSLQKPKSASLMAPLLKRMLVGLMSLCRMCASQSASKAALSCSRILRASSSERVPLRLMYSARVPPLQYQQTRQQLLGVQSISTNLMILGWEILERMLIQLLVNSVSLGVCLNLSVLMTLTAQCSLVFLCQARQTLPYCPEPIFSCRIQSSIALFIKLQLTTPAAVDTGSPHSGGIIIMQQNSLHFYLLPQQVVHFERIQPDTEIVYAQQIVEDRTSQALISALKYRYPLKYLGEDCEQLLVLCIPAYQHRIVPEREGRKAESRVMRLIKTGKETEVKGFLSGRRSAILMQNGRLIRYKGCGNDTEGFISEDKGLRGSHFIHTAKRQLYMTALINNILKQQVNEPSANHPILFYEFNDVKQYGLRNDLKLMPKYCCVFETEGDRRVGTHLISPLEIIFLNIVQPPAQEFDAFFNAKGRLDQFGLVQLLTDFELFLESGQSFLSKYDQGKQFTNYVTFDDYAAHAKTQIRQSESIESLVAEIRTKFTSGRGGELMLQASTDWMKVINILLQKLGWQMGQVKRIFCEKEINWGFFNDHGYFHCNAHLNNFVIKVPRQGQRFVLPLDFDLAFLKAQYVNIDTKSPLYGREDSQTFEQFLLSEYNAMEMSVSGVEIMNFKYSIREEESDPPQSIKQARIVFRDTLIKAFRWGMRRNEEEYRRINKLWDENIEDIRKLVELCLIVSANFQT